MLHYLNDFTAIHTATKWINILIITSGTKEEKTFSYQQRTWVYHKNNLRITEYLVFPDDTDLGICGERFNIVLVDEQIPQNIYEKILDAGGYANAHPRLTAFYNIKSWEEMCEEE